MILMDYIISPCFRNHIFKIFCWFGLTGVLWFYQLPKLQAAGLYGSLLFYCLCIFKRLMKCYVQFHQSKLRWWSSYEFLSKNFRLRFHGFCVLGPWGLGGWWWLESLFEDTSRFVHYDRSEPGFHPYIFMTTLGTLPRPHIDFSGYAHRKSLR